MRDGPVGWQRLLGEPDAQSHFPCSSSGPRRRPCHGDRKRDAPVRLAHVGGDRLAARASVARAGMAPAASPGRSPAVRSPHPSQRVLGVRVLAKEIGCSQIGPSLRSSLKARPAEQTLVRAPEPRGVMTPDLLRGPESCWTGGGWAFLPGAALSPSAVRGEHHGEGGAKTAVDRVVVAGGEGGMGTGQRGDQVDELLGLSDPAQGASDLGRPESLRACAPR